MSDLLCIVAELQQLNCYIYLQNLDNLLKEYNQQLAQDKRLGKYKCSIHSIT